MRGPTPRSLPPPYRRSAVDPLFVRLDGNEGAVADPVVLDELARSLRGDAVRAARLLRDYPSSEPLRELLAQRFAVDRTRVAVTAGADGALDRLFRAYLEPGDEVLVAEPTFEMFPRFAALAGSTLVGAPWRAEFPVDALVAVAGPRARMALVVSPNNPTGAVVDADTLERFARALPGTLVVLDHVYVEYATADLTALALTLPNVVVVRTFSKARGLAACRVGYALGPEAVIEAITAAGEPYPVAALSLAVAEASLLAGDGPMLGHVVRIQEHRRILRQALAALGAPTRDSQANFVYVEIGERAESVHRALLADSLAVRSFPGALRITVPHDVAVLTRLLQSLPRAFASGAPS
jgi:histidinol-phosphate aminotransferase